MTTTATEVLALLERADALPIGTARLDAAFDAQRAAVNFCRDELPAMMAENARLQEALAKATKPSFYWDSEDSENGCDDLTVIMDNHDLGYVARLQCAANLPDQWAVGFVNETGGFEAKAFATEAEAVAFAEARAALSGAA